MTAFQQTMTVQAQITENIATDTAIWRPIQPQPERARRASGHAGDQPVARPDRQAAAPDADMMAAQYRAEAIDRPVAARRPMRKAPPPNSSAPARPTPLRPTVEAAMSGRPPCRGGPPPRCPPAWGLLPRSDRGLFACHASSSRRTQDISAMKTSTSSMIF
jgi:hypothetical protein